MAAPFAVAEPKTCALCFYQKRRCTRDCVLAPYFPKERLSQFTNARKLFGVNNMIKFIQSIREEYRKGAMKSIIYEAEMRARDPVFGSCGIVRRIAWEIRNTEAELATVLQMLALLRGDPQETQQCFPGGYGYFPPPQ